MNKQVVKLTSQSISPNTNNVLAEGAESRLAVQQEMLLLTNSLLALLKSRFPLDNPEIQYALAFLHSFEGQHVIAGNTASVNLFNVPLSTRLGRYPNSALTQLVEQFGLTELEVQLLILSGMTQEHEGFANTFTSLHPHRQPFATAALLAQMNDANPTQRLHIASFLVSSKLITKGVVELEADAPLFAACLKIAPQDWHALSTKQVALTGLSPIPDVHSGAGLQDWFSTPEVEQGKYYLANNSFACVHLHNNELETAVQRALALSDEIDLPVLAISIDGKTKPVDLQRFYLHCLMTQHTPLISVAPTSMSELLNLTLFDDFPGCLLVCTQTGYPVGFGQRFLIELHIVPLGFEQTVSMWHKLLPELGAQTAILAARFRFEPFQAKRCVERLHSMQRNHQTPVTQASTIELLKQYHRAVLPSSVTRIKPELGWQDLVLPDTQTTQLKDAVARLDLQHTVLDCWQFLHNRRGSRGVRLLFCGAPGTGKTLAAEVMASALKVDLLTVDLSVVVSKWIGETEKNLAQIFSYAEQMQAVLFFDEADAIFGKRTEINDAHDRYANLETAFLLSRLEDYDGLAILATNFRNNIDPAFVRRLDYIIEFRPPSAPDRERLWSCHVPETAPLGNNVNFSELANLFPLVGGEIRNAAVGAAYLAAQQQQLIDQQHFIKAIRMENDKSGKAFREVSSFKD